jgi:hypothetical protein
MRWSGWYFEVSSLAVTLRRSFHRLHPQDSAFNPEFHLIPRLQPEAVAQGFGDSDLILTADSHNLHHHMLPVALLEYSMMYSS